MGDYKVKLDSMDERESRGHLHKSVKGMVGKGPSGSGTKSQSISAKVYPDMWERFSRINKSQGMSNGSVLNKLIAEYVRDNAKWIGGE